VQAGRTGAARVPRDQRGERVPRTYLLPTDDQRPHRLVGRAQPAGMGHAHHAAVADHAGEGDDTRARRPYGRHIGRRQIDPAMAG